MKIPIHRRKTGRIVQEDAREQAAIYFQCFSPSKVCNSGKSISQETKKQDYASDPLPCVSARFADRELSKSDRKEVNPGQLRE